MNESEQMLFSVVTNEGTQEASATEALLCFGVFEAWDAVTPLFPNHAVGKPIPVMAEGTYYVKAKVGNEEKYREVKFSAADIERIGKKQPRDVPFNYDHRRVAGKEGVKGWLRFGEKQGQTLSFVGKLQTKDGEVTALFATPEFSEEAVGMVASGVYRDVSVEYRGVDDVLTGCALTSYPVMRNLQFSDLDVPEDEQTTPETPVVPDVEAAELPKEEEMDPATLTPEQRKELFKSLLAEHGLTPEVLTNLGEQLQTSQEAAAKSAREAALAKAETEINSLLGDSHFGMTDDLATQSQEVLAWTATESTLNFGEQDGAPDVAGAVKGLLGVIGKLGKQITLLGGPAAAKDADGAEHFGEVVTDDEPDLNKKTVSGLASLAKSLL